MASFSDANESLKVAIAMALLRSKLLQKPKPPPPPPPADLPSTSSAPFPSEAFKWKRKAKERKQVILRLKEDLKQAEDGLQFDLFPQSASCKCYFFENLGKLSPKTFGDNSDWRFSNVLRRRFLRQVRLNERRRRTDGSTHKQYFSDCNNEDEMEQLRASVDFLVELCETVSSIRIEDPKFVNWSHQAVDFILASIKNLSFMGKNVEPVEGIVNSLIMRLMRRMCAALEGDGNIEYVSYWN